MNLDFSNINVLLIGDLMLDHYIIGTSVRVSPEAPVPVVLPKNEYSIPGGAGNVAMNLRGMGANVSCIGCVGNDSWGKKLISILQKNNIDTQYIEIINSHPTTLKQRIYSDDRQVARIDTEQDRNWVPSVKVEKLYDHYDIIILSDYNKGVFFSPWFKSKKNNVILDPKKKIDHIWSNANIVTPNLNELKIASKLNVDNDKKVVEACRSLMKEFKNLQYIVAKKSERGITIVGRDSYVKHISPYEVKSPDVTGAGDTVIAVMSVVYAETKDIELSVTTANIAASIVVGQSGTATININKIKKLIEKR
ncbi:MAG: hypothetical protein HOL62_02560 [Candidatus Marinimicrobia bacterium]|nr:hypothetical protein [Candidatus Neomarinimicrobiota bacterium]MBT5856761.1 hypothetical protein [Flavobacteriaceae bacterium]MBT5251568.1 hypothetical protein [Candidatus Neomarinimicrobiota bacterium]MBT5490120.1 hypothetical protein [Candidatus Neomarinimicrobiota bacterium]MBT6839906.1 hypothetical protein [Candidatus Neomarinimicrobiota bacterium]